MNSDYMQSLIYSIDFMEMKHIWYRREFMLYFRVDDPSDFVGRTFLTISEEIGLNALVILVVLAMYSIAFLLYAQCYVEMFRTSKIRYKVLNIISNVFVVLPLRDPSEKDFDEDKNEILCRAFIRILENVIMTSVTVCMYYLSESYNYERLDRFVLYFMTPILAMDLLAILFLWIYNKTNALRISKSDISVNNRILYNVEVSEQALITACELLVRACLL